MTRLMVLGLLLKSPMSGYDIQQMLELSRADTWAGILPGSIYHALKKMESEELIAIEEVIKTGNRSKAVYKITEKGRLEYLRLIEENLGLPNLTLPTGLYTAIFFLKDLEKEKALSAIDKQIIEIEAKLEESKQGQLLKEQFQSIPKEGQLIFENVFNHYQLHLSFLNDLKQMINAD